VDWYSRPPSTGDKKRVLYVNRVMVHRKGDFIYPVSLVATFDSGEVVRETWDGQERWHRWEWTREARLVSAEINSGQAIMLDTNPFNDSYVVKADTRATNKLGTYWMVITQWACHLLTWLV
jgi:hypothetical protein